MGFCTIQKQLPGIGLGISLATHWTWQPGSAGQFTLVAFGKDAAGQTGYFQPQAYYCERIYRLSHRHPDRGR